MKLLLHFGRKINWLYLCGSVSPVLSAFPFLSSGHKDGALDLGSALPVTVYILDQEARRQQNSKRCLPLHLENIAPLIREEGRKIPFMQRFRLLVPFVHHHLGWEAS